MEDNKYYTPDISEFYVGFEYEEDIRYIYSDGDYDLDGGENWIEWTIDKQDDLEHLIDLIEDGRLRVKYLDREDIESLGFINKINSFATSQIVALMGEVHNFYTKDNCVITFCYKDTNMDHNNYYIDISIEEKRVFLGHIKNISTLKVLLKQLGIE